MTTVANALPVGMSVATRVAIDGVAVRSIDDPRSCTSCTRGNALHVDPSLQHRYAPTVAPPRGRSSKYGGSLPPSLPPSCVSLEGLLAPVARFVATWRLSWHDRQDALQEILHELLLRATRGRPVNEAVAIGIARHVCYDFAARSARARQGMVALDCARAVAARDSTGAVIVADVHDRLRHVVVSKIGPKAWGLVVAVHVDGLSWHSAARQQGVSPYEMRRLRDGFSRIIAKIDSLERLPLWSPAVIADTAPTTS